MRVHALASLQSSYEIPLELGGAGSTQGSPSGQICPEKMSCNAEPTTASCSGL